MLATGQKEASERAVVNESATEPGNWFEETAKFWDSFELFLPIEEDSAPEAQELLNQTKLVDKMTQEQEDLLARKSYLRGKADQTLGKELDKLQGLVFAYWTMRLTRIVNKESIRKGFVSALTYGNVIFVAIFLRTVVPRLLLVTNMDDFLGIANEIGIPSKGNLLAAIDGLQQYDFLVKVACFTLAFIVEKVTLISEILPIQVGLKALAPVVFGGLVPGALVAATCETVGAMVNFFVGRTLLADRLRGIAFFGGPPVGESAWFGRLEGAAEKNGFQLTLLLRLSHILPIPFDSYWYILGSLPVRAVDFVAAHWLGCLKTSFLDACLGVLLLTSAGLSMDGEEKQQIIFAESIGFAVVAFLVQTFATGLAKDILGLEDEEGGDENPPAAQDEQSGQPTKQ